jgi:hypothetical protein
MPLSGTTQPCRGIAHQLGGMISSPFWPMARDCCCGRALDHVDPNPQFLLQPVDLKFTTCRNLFDTNSCVVLLRRRELCPAAAAKKGLAIHHDIMVRVVSREHFDRRALIAAVRFVEPTLRGYQKNDDRIVVARVRFSCCADWTS